MLNDKD